MCRVGFRLQASGLDTNGRRDSSPAVSLAALIPVLTVLGEDTAAMDEPIACAYELDSDLRITRVDTRWSQCAIANEAPELVPPPGPLGQSALSCVADLTSAVLYERLFHRVLETGTTIALPFRCDAPARRRYMNLIIEPCPPDGLRVETTLRRTEDRPAVALLERNTPRANDWLRFCGWCKLVDVAGRWCEVEDAIAELRLFERARLPLVTHGMCPQCHERVSRAIDSA